MTEFSYWLVTIQFPTCLSTVTCECEGPIWTRKLFEKVAINAGLPAHTVANVLFAMQLSKEQFDHYNNKE